MEIIPIYTKSPLRNFSYLVRDGNNALCIDPFDGEAVAARLQQEGLTLRGIINTHEHFDHICGNAALVEATGAPVWCPEGASVPHAKPLLYHDQQLSITLDDPGPEALANGRYIEVLDTPGHTMTHICLMTMQGGKPQGLITGDLFFNGGVGNCRNGGDPEVMYETVKDTIMPLPDDVLIYPGHDYLASNLQFMLSIDDGLTEAKELVEQYPQSDTAFIRSDLALEKRISLFFRTHEPAVQDKVLAAAGAQVEPGDDVAQQTFLALRRLRDRW